MRLGRFSLLTGALVLITCSVSTAGWVGLQKDGSTHLRARLSEEEKAALNKSESNNDKIKTYVRFAEQRLRNARADIEKEDSALAGREVSAYAALVADAGLFARASVPKRDKAHKTLETALREQYRVLEGLKRDIGVSQLSVLEDALQIVSKVRRQSLNLFLGEDKVLSEVEKP